MPAIEYVDRYQTAVLWPKTGNDRYGEPSFGPPIELAPPYGVRWLTKKRDALDSQGNKVQVDGTVIVGQDIAVGSDMWLGTLASWYASGSAGVPDDLCWVVAFNTTPDLKGRETRRSVLVKRYKDSLTDG